MLSVSLENSHLQGYIGPFRTLLLHDYDDDDYDYDYDFMIIMII